jgi:Ca-activated chloride channel family protein
MFPIYLVSIMAGFLFWAQSTVAGQFTADMVETHHGTNNFSRIAVKNDRYRISTRENSEEVSVIVDESRGKTWVLVPSRRIVLEKDINDPQNLVKNPFQAFRYMVEKYGSTRDGLEQIDGYRCDRISVTIQGKKAATAWMAEKLAFPVKIVNHINKRMVELKNVCEKQIDDKIFNVPPDAGKTATSLPSTPNVHASQASPNAPGEMAGIAGASARGSVLFILDASGSMWGKVDGQPKIAIAKSVMSDLSDRLPTDMRVGLMAYGHRRKGDCRDIEILVRVGRRDLSALKAKIKALNPKGKTPLSAAVEQAAENLRYTEERATVVLVSDGLETCNADPCKLAEKLAMHGVDFTVHVIGFDLSKAEQARLRCLSDKTGGLFLTASDAGALRSALLKTVEKVKQPPPVVKETPGTAKLDGPDSVPAGAAFAIKWQGPDSLRDYITISKKGSEDNLYVDYVYTKTGNPVRMMAPGDTGDYELRYVHAHSHRVIGRSDIEVTQVTAHVTAPPSAAVATKISAKWQGPGYEGDYISIAEPDQAPASYLGYTYVSDGNPLKLQMPPDPGTYEVRYIMNKGSKLLAKTTITLTAP